MGPWGPSALYKGKYLLLSIIGLSPLGLPAAVAVNPRPAQPSSFVQPIDDGMPHQTYPLMLNMAQPTTAPRSQNKGLVGAIMGIKDAGKLLLFDDEVQTPKPRDSFVQFDETQINKTISDMSGMELSVLYSGDELLDMQDELNRQRDFLRKALRTGKIEDQQFFQDRPFSGTELSAIDQDKVNDIINDYQRLSSRKASFCFVAWSAGGRTWSNLHRSLFRFK